MADNKVIISDSYYFTADDNQYILYEYGKREKIDIKTKKKTGEVVDYETVVGYYGTIEALINGCKNNALRRKVSEGEITTINGIVDFISNFSENMDKLLEKIKGY